MNLQPRSILRGDAGYPARLRERLGADAPPQLTALGNRNLAALYGVTTGNLNKAVRRNLDRFPSDFMFQLTPEEAENLRFQNGISSSGYGGRRYLPYAFSHAQVRGQPQTGP